MALAIVSIALVAAIRATGMATESSMAVRGRTLALWIAQNRLEEIRAFDLWLPIGNAENETVQGNIRFMRCEKVTATANDNFRRIEINVYEIDERDYALASLTGYVYKKDPI